MHRGRKRLRVSEVNPHLICVLCGGYYIDATTITECLHTFCKTCIVGYLEASKHCPVCDNLVHKNKPHLRLRPDHALQDLVYKLVPGLFKDEMTKRRQFYQDEIEAGKLEEGGCPEERERIIYSPDEQISLVLELSPDGQPPVNPGYRSSKHHRLEAADRRYLLCPANITIAHLKKFIKMKFNVCDRFQVDFYHTDESLHDHYTLVDVAYIYSWRRQGPLRLYYSVYTNPAKKFKEDITVSVPMELDSSKCSDEKIETSGYISDEDKLESSSVTVMEVSHANRSNTSESGIDSMNESNTSEIETVLNDKQAVPSDIPHEDVNVKDTQNVLNDENLIPSDIAKEDEHLKGIEDVLCIENTAKEICNIAKEKVEDNASVSIPLENGVCNDKEGSVDTKVEPITVDTSCIWQNTPSRNNVGETSSHACDTATKVCEESAIMCEESTKVCDEKVMVCEESTSVEHADMVLGQDIPPATELTAPAKTSEMPSKAEASTSTSPTPVSDKQEILEPTVVKSNNSVKSHLKEQEVSEPVVSSTQNTQACQTEPPDNGIEIMDVKHSQDENISKTVILAHKSTVDVSCETDNFVLSRQLSKESVSVSTETEGENNDRSRKLVDCSTDVYDFPTSETETKNTVDCSTDFDGFPQDSNNQQSLTVDCTTDMNDLQAESDRRKSFSSAIQTDDRAKVKTEVKAPKRSISYSGPLTAHKAEYLAQPLSPTKLTLKFSAPKQAVPTPHKSLSRAETSGFQSQYQSFVRDLPVPDTSYDFEDDEESREGAKLTGPKHEYSKNKQPIYSPVPNLSLTIPKKPSKSGRPRGRPPKNRSSDAEHYVKEKKHKSRSHSPKRRKHSSDKSDKHAEKHGEKRKSGHSPSGQKPSHGSTPYSWINKLDSDSKTSSERKQQKSKPDNLSAKSTSATTTTSSDLKIPKQILYLSNGQYTLATASSLNALKQSSPVSPTRTVSETLTSSYGDKHSQSEKSKDKKLNKSEKTTSNKSETKVQYDKKFYRSKSEVHKRDTSSKESKTDSTPNVFKTDSNQNTIVNTSKSSVSEGIVNNGNSDANEAQTAVSTVKSPEYRHQSPFFASFSGAKLGTQRTNTHLNIPNLNSHFSGTHQLYSQSRYMPDRLTQPVFRSLSLTDKTATPAMDTKLHNKFSMDSIRSPCTFLPFTSPYPFSFTHLHAPALPSLPCNVSPKGYSPDSTRSPTHPPVETHSHVTNNSAKATIKSPNVGRKKEKSIDTVISAITERARKESTAHEQVNGIDLSTKSSRQKDKLDNFSVHRTAVDKYAFTDDEDNKHKLKFKSGQIAVDQKSAK